LDVHILFVHYFSRTFEARKERLKAQQNLSDKEAITKLYQYYQSFPENKQNTKWWDRMRERASVWGSRVT
jgi:hypothetical protein